MAPRKKKTQQKIPNDNNSKKKTKTAAKKPNTKKRAPVKRVITKKPRQSKKSTITKSSESYVEDTKETGYQETSSNELSTTLNDTLIASIDCSSVECENSIDAQSAENEDSTYDVTEPHQHLEVQEQNVIQEELIEFDSVDNVITVDYVSQEVILEDDNENSNSGTIALVETEEINEKEMEVWSEMKTNDIEKNLSQMMNQLEIPQSKDSPSIEDCKDKQSECLLEDNLNSNQSDQLINHSEECYKNFISIEELEDIKIEDVKLQSDENKDEIINSTVNTENRIDKSFRAKTKKPNESKSIKGQKKEKTISVKAKTSQKSKTDELDDGSIRRSSRIKSISVLKKPSVGHGLVKVKDCEASDVKNEIEKFSSTQSTTNRNEPSEKPIKVKSRWRRSSELEMNVSSSEPGSSMNMKQNQNINIDSEKGKINSPAKDEMVESRLKQFVHLKENVYLTERFICKEAKKMTCDCFLTEEEKERGEMACGEDCLNRLLMIEW